jgi:hypothetical protein
VIADWVIAQRQPEGRTISSDVPAYSRYPMSLLMKLIVAKAAMLIHR